MRLYFNKFCIFLIIACTITGCSSGSSKLSSKTPEEDISVKYLNTIQENNSLKDTINSLQTQNNGLKKTIESLQQENKELDQNRNKQNNSIVILDYEAVNSLINRAHDMQFLVFIGSLKCNYNEAITYNDRTYYKVIDNRYKDMNSLKEALKEVFTQDIVNNLVSTNNLVMVNGAFYSSDGGLGVYQDWDKRIIKLVSIDNENLKVKYRIDIPRIYSEGGKEIDLESRYITLMYIDGKWKVCECDHLF